MFEQNQVWLGIATPLTEPWHSSVKKQIDCKSGGLWKEVTDCVSICFLHHGAASAPLLVWCLLCCSAMFAQAGKQTSVWPSAPLDFAQANNLRGQTSVCRNHWFPFQYCIVNIVLSCSVWVSRMEYYREPKILKHSPTIQYPIDLFIPPALHNMNYEHFQLTIFLAPMEKLQRQTAFQWSLLHCDLMQLRELYGLAILGVPASLVQLCLFCLAIQTAGLVEACAVGYSTFS